MIPEGPPGPPAAGRRPTPLTDLRIADQVRGQDDGTDPFVAAVRATRMPMIITDPRQADNPVVFANDAFCRLSGYERHEILGRNCRFLQCAETDPEAVRRIREAVAAVQPIEIDIRNQRKNGDLFWNRLLMAPVHDSTGRLAYFFGSQLDVSLERERLAGLETNNASLMAELTDRLRFQQEREREMAFAMRAGRFGTWSIELSSMELTASETCKELFGRPADEPFRYRDRLGAILPEDRELAERAMARALAGGGYDSTYRIRRPDGTVRWLESRGQAFTDEAGRPLRISGVSFDVTAEHRAGRMRAALVELSDIFRNQDDPEELGFQVSQLLGRTLKVDRAGYGLIDAGAETVVIGREWTVPGIRALVGTHRFRDFGTYVDDLRRGETVVVTDARQDPRTRATAPALEAIAGRALVNFPLMEQRGLVAILYLSQAEARDWQEDELSFVREVAARTRETSERRRAEQALARLAASLETEVQQRTRELMQAEEQLRQSQKMEAVGQLTGGLAHDFNNLLTAIGGSLELLQARVTQGRLTDLDRFVNAAQGAVRRASALTHRLLAFSRRQTLAPKPTDVTKLITGMEELIRRTVGPSVTLEVVTASGLWTALVDPPQLENALLNLCINARDAMPSGGRITVETANKWLDERQAKERDLPPGQYLLLSVTDNGTGMSPELITHIFDPFFTTKPLGQGTGLGLSMIYGFARQSGGQVRVYSEPGQGTTMSLYLPRHLGEGGAEPDSAPPPQATRARQGETVLVVDDEPVVRMLAAEVLLDLGYAAIEASDGASGLKVLESDARIDLLLTDVGLPGGMNGRQLADAARTLRPGLKVLFVTGYAENAVLSHGHLGPGMQVLTKPFAMTALADRIRGLIAG